ncbi:MAG: ABC transporter ATP-binding protein/permease [Acidimicrobiia bacterium]|nr:ABC transporter ATP-binding protein/permease [Acidimicrobiia bacterium]
MEGTESAAPVAADTGVTPKVRALQAQWSTLMALVRPQKFAYGGLTLALTVLALLPLFGPLLVGRAVDQAIAGADGSELVRLGLLYLALALAGQITAAGVAWASTSLAWRTANDLRMQMVEHVFGLDQEFHQHNPPGALIQRIDGDITSVSDFLSQVVTAVGSAILILLGTVTILAILDWRLALAMGAYIGVAGTVAFRYRGRLVNESEGVLSARARLYGGIEERLNAAEDIRSNGAGPHVMGRFVDDASFFLDTRMREEGAFVRLWWGLNLAIVICTVASLILGATMVSAGAITIGTAFVLFQYTQQIRRPLDSIVERFEVAQKAVSALNRVAKLRAERPTILDLGTTSPPPGPLSVEFDDVEFHYFENEPVLRGVSFELAPGRSLGVVGRSGSGKTTMSRIVARLLETTSGTVRLGGVPIADIPLAELRRRVAVVPQEVQLYQGSLRDNVALFHDADEEHYSDEAVERTLRDVGLGHLLDGVGLGPGDGARRLDRSVFDADVGLSAGESQLLALARVWLRRPDLVVLDEATARIDPRTERIVGKAIRELLAGRTSIVIAHRLSTLQQVDDIAVFDNGQLIEFGPRVDLAKRDGGYYRRLLDFAAADLTEGADATSGDPR